MNQVTRAGVVLEFCSVGDLTAGGGWLYFTLLWAAGHQDARNSVWEPVRGMIAGRHRHTPMSWAEHEGGRHKPPKG